MSTKAKVGTKRPAAEELKRKGPGKRPREAPVAQEFETLTPGQLGSIKPLFKEGKFKGKIDFTKNYKISFGLSGLRFVNDGTYTGPVKKGQKAVKQVKPKKPSFQLSFDSSEEIPKFLTKATEALAKTAKNVDRLAKCTLTQPFSDKYNTIKVSVGEDAVLTGIDGDTLTPQMVMDQIETLKDFYCDGVISLGTYFMSTTNYYGITAKLESLTFLHPGDEAEDSEAKTQDESENQD